MGDLYNSPWVVKKKDGVGGSQVVYSASNFPRARDESRRLNMEEGVDDKFYAAPAVKEEGVAW